ncbi:MAG: bacterial transcriptional activator domain-containing protein [Chloroflexi bacterium]|nr:bacterial transcriptional activator domain-containing protein [Chloroflexota bacterium]MCI0574737.1 bacterial transcriptional activator domain-containing protein [Chloroflexota bacterium]MCI0646292.1 bacterial transcriptional activator domain-containing protein [Chloroflexota bacterium]MCI0730310.1 bacterial transcriptional activator domain-containing protein [Chloroflexota bacterium]
MAREIVTEPPVGELYVQTLGRFAIWQNGERRPDNVWGRDKARQLFQYLITYRRRFTIKERIMDDLWPALDPDKADRDFKVALNALNTALQPDRPSRTLSVYVARQGASYGLNGEAPIRLDVTEFEDGLAAGSRAEGNDRPGAIAHYQEALKLYQGEYLPDTIYEDWASAERERLAALYLSGATRLARLLLEEGSIVEMLMWCQRVIALDPCWEEAYRLLMRGHMANGNRPLAMRVYRQCRAALAEELGIEPMAETIRLYEQVVAGEG